jgi:hypothetical protein
MPPGIKILRGSDSLAFTSEYNRAGRFGFSTSGYISLDQPEREIKKMLTDKEIDLKGSFRFLHNQIAIKIVKIIFEKDLTTRT